MKMKRLLSASIASIMAVGMLAGCGGGSGPDVEDYADTGEHLTIKWLGYPRNPGAEADTIPEKTIEEKFNVDIEPYFFEENKYQDKKVMLMAGGDVPDLIYELDPAHVVVDVEQDFAAEIPYETIKQYAPEYFAYVNEYAPASWVYSRYDGKNYGIPNVNHSHMESKVVAWRKDWLDKYNLSVPKTLDEVHTALDKFVHEDPDGNGKNDTYGMHVGGTHYQSYFTEIFGAYGCLPFDWQEAEDGTIVYGGTTDECKEALALLAQWNKEGLIHPDFVLGTGESEAWNSGQLGYRITSYSDPNDSKSLINTVKATNPNAEMAYGYLPTGPDGESGARAWGPACHVISFGMNEGYGAKGPRMLQIIEGLFTDFDLAKTVRIGNEGETYEAAPADTTKKSNFVMLAGYGAADTAETRIKGLSTDFSGPTFWAPVAPKKEDYESTLSESYKTWAAEWQDEKYCLVNPFYKVDVVPSSSDYIIDLRNKQMAVMNKIINGEVGIDAYETEFISQWNSGGGKIMTEEANQIKDEYAAIKTEIGIQ